MAVMDLTGAAGTTALLREAQTRGCNTIAPRRVLLQQVTTQARLLSGKETPAEVLEQTLAGVMHEDF
jgi:shikimate 5-dehydrogenase